MTKTIVWSSRAREDFRSFERSDPKVARRIVALIRAIQEDPFRGIGKPEPLKFNLKGYWSRRITDEHRLVYRVSDESILIAQARYHY